MGLKSSIAGATFPYQSILPYSLVLHLRTNCKAFLSGEPAPPGSEEAFLSPPATTVWVGQTRMHWLPYFGGFVTALRLRDAPILTGKMSGCPLSIFIYKGEPYMGHVGTVDDNEQDAAAKNAAVKRAWQAAVVSGKIRPVLAWNPAGDIGATTFTGTPHIFGVATAQSKAYSLRCTEALNVFTVADVRNADTLEGVQCVRSVLAAKARDG